MIPSLRNTLALALLLAAGSASFAAEAKRVIVVTVTTGFRHSSIPFAEAAIKKLGEDSKAFTVVDIAQQPKAQIVKKPSAPKKPGDLKPDADEKARAKYDSEMKKYEGENTRYLAATEKWTAADDAKAKESQAEWDAQMKASMDKLSPANLAAQKIDGVIFANTTGDLPLPDRDGFIKWIEAGHGFAAMHSGSDTFHGFPGYLDMLQGEFAGHGAQVPADLVAGDTSHPVNAGIGATWQIAQEEMYHIKHHDRSKLRALWFMRHDPNDASKLDYFPVSWCRMAGKGKVFYTSLGHRDELWSDDPAMRDRKNSVDVSKQYLAHILAGIKWSLGLVEGSAEPNPETK